MGTLFFLWRVPAFEARVLLVPEVGQGVSPAEAVKGAAALARQLAIVVQSGDAAAKVAAKDAEVSAWLATRAAGSWSRHVSAEVRSGGVLVVRGRHADGAQARRLAEGTTRFLLEQGSAYLPVRSTVLLLDPSAPRPRPWVWGVICLLISIFAGSLLGFGLQKVLSPKRQPPH